MAHLHIVVDDLTLDECVLLEDAGAGHSMKEVRQFIASHLTNGNGYLPTEEGLALIGPLKVGELRTFLAKGMEVLKESAVPLASEKNSSTQSGPDTAAPPGLPSS